MVAMTDYCSIYQLLMQPVLEELFISKCRNSKLNLNSQKVPTSILLHEFNRDAVPFGFCLIRHLRACRDKDERIFVEES